MLGGRQIWTWGITEAIRILRIEGGPEERERREMDSSGISKHESENRMKLHIPPLYPWFTESEPEILGVCPINVYLNNKNNIIFSVL